MSHLISPEILLRWPTSEEFYRERDDRTAREVEKLGSYVHRPVALYVDPAHAGDWSVQAVAILAANLLARWARRVWVVSPDVALAPPLGRVGLSMLHARMQSEMRCADPFGQFQYRTPDQLEPDGIPTEALRLFVGPWSGSTLIQQKDFLVHAAGWVALGQRGGALPNPADSRASISAVGLAAALGVGDLFKRAVGHPAAEWMPSFTWCTWTHTFSHNPRQFPNPALPAVPNVMDLGRTLLAGTGAIGSALLYLLDLGSATGTLGLLDRDHVETSNLNRSPLFRVGHVLANTHKVDACWDAVRGVAVECWKGTWTESAAQISAAGYDLWVSLTNEDGAWAEIPFQMPPVVVHATTTSGWGFGAGRHVPGMDDCTLCRMPRPSAEFRARCAEGEIALPEAPPIRASLPFLSVAAASLLAAEVVKAHDPARAVLPNDVSVDVRRGLPALIAISRRALPTCRGCRAAAVRSAA